MSGRSGRRRHAWVKLRLHVYICATCGTGKVNENRHGQWVTTFHLPTGRSLDSRHVPACVVGPKTERYLAAHADTIRRAGEMKAAMKGQADRG